MRDAICRRMQWLLVTGVLIGAWGCVSTMLPSPVFQTPRGIQSSYDADVPLREALAIKTAGLTDDWAVPYLFLRTGMHFESLGDEERSLHFYNRAIHECRKRNNEAAEGTAFSRKLSALIRFGRTGEARLVLDAQAKKWSQSPLNAFVFYNYGYYHLKNGNYAQARDYFKRALGINPANPENADWLALRRDSELGSGAAIVLGNYFPAVYAKLGLSNFDEGFYRNLRINLNEGMAHLEQVSGLNSDIRNTKLYFYLPQIIPSYMACDLDNLLGLSYGMAGQNLQAVKHLDKAQSEAQKNNYLLGEADNLFFRNQIYLLDKNRVHGLQAARSLAEIADQYQLISYAIWAQMVKAHHHYESGQADLTLTSLERAVALMEENKPWLSCDGDFRGIRHFSRQLMDEALLDLYTSQSNFSAAFRTAERAREAMLADQLSSEAMGEITSVPDGIAQLRGFYKQMSVDYRTLMASGTASDVFKKKVLEIDKTRKASVLLLDRIKHRGAVLCSLINTSSPGADEIQRLLDDNTTVFAYYAGERHLYIWVISKSRFQQKRIRMPRQDVEQLVQDYRDALVSGDKSRADSKAEKVYDAFLKPAISFVSGDRLVILPHGPLYNMPFASMRYVESYLVDGFDISQLPHAGMMLNVPTAQPFVPGAGKALIVKDIQCAGKQPSDVNTRKEIDGLKKIFPQATIFIRKDNGDDWEKLTGLYDIIHCILKEVSGEQRRLNPSSPSTESAERHGYLSLQRIFHLQVKGDVSIWSVCRGANDQSFTRIEMKALQAAWLYTVGPSLIAQLWDVDEKAKALMMDMFYKNLMKSGSAANALRKAQNIMIQSGYGPSAWAAFVLTSRY